MRYPGPGPDALTDGLRASENHRDGIWQGWWDHDLEATIDLGRMRTVRSVELSFLENEGAWILPPDSVAVFLSRDGCRWTEIGVDPTGEDPPDAGTAGDGRARKVDVSFSVDGRAHGDRAKLPEARYVRIQATRALLPAAHPGAGESGWIFADEIVVR
ncbi:MAG: discoidin domain-containing protein, partial [Gemmatimonadota bacterium]